MATITEDYVSFEGMTLQEAIKHCEDVASQQCNNECCAEHKQLAEWLIELQNYKTLNYINKNDLLKRIERRLKKYQYILDNRPVDLTDIGVLSFKNKKQECKEILDIINSFEVKK